jgi:pantoate--beta-alanine ligase
VRVVHTVRELQALAEAQRRAGSRIALVPTMGALHRGHLALVQAARAAADRTCVSIYVNPTQFGPGEDLAAYPRTLDADLEACRAAGVDQAFVPADAELWERGHETWVEVSELSKPLCGRSRPVHFRGVATVVTKLLLAAQPHVVVFGEKDFQQLALVRRLVRDLGFAVEVLGVPTLREPDGLALSSRNQRLDPEARAEAACLVRALGAAASAVVAGERSAAALLSGVRAEIAKAPRAEIDYAELRDPESLAPAPEHLDGPTLLALAVFLPAAHPPGSRVRLIDNCVLHPRAEETT